jgi:hypothetical protein
VHCIIVQRGFLKMATYNGRNRDAEFVSYSCTPRHPSPTLVYDNERLLNSYSNKTRVNLSSVFFFKEECMDL